jgi:ankyrin repeat protein
MTNQDGSTALIEAAQRGHASMVTLLLSTKADINHTNNVSRWECRYQFDMSELIVWNYGYNLRHLE